MALHPLRLPAIVIVALAAATTAGAQTLEKRLQTALDAGDMDSVLALAEIRESPVDVWLALHSLVVDCVNDMKCTVAAGSKAELQSLQGGLAAQGAEYPVAVEGVVVVNQTGDGAKGEVTIPYGRVGGQPRLIGARYTAAKLAELRAKTAEAIVEAMLARGLFDPVKGEQRTDWKKTAKRLPAGGGDAGAALVRQATAMADAVKANDPDAAVRAVGGPLGEALFGARRYDGAAIPLKTRQLKLRAQSTRFVTDARVLGGYQLGDQAVLAFEGTNGRGWVERGAIVMTRAGSGWEKGEQDTVSHPR